MRVGTHAHAAINPTSANHDTTVAGSNHQSGRRGDGTNATARENWSAVQALIVRVVPAILIASSTCTSATSPAGCGSGRDPPRRRAADGGEQHRRRRVASPSRRNDSGCPAAIDSAAAAAPSPKLAISHRRAVGVT